MTTGFRGDRTSIAAVQGASSATIQALLADFAAGLAREGVRVAGIVEVAASAPQGGCRDIALRDLASGALISISQDLGPGSTACNLDADGLAAACVAVERSLARGADLAVISKFGKQEAARSGLADAFRAAVEAGVPILTAVNPSMAAPWSAFAGALAEVLPAEREALASWWRRSVSRTLSSAA